MGLTTVQRYCAACDKIAILRLTALLWRFYVVFILKTRKYFSVCRPEVLKCIRHFYRAAIC